MITLLAILCGLGIFGALCTKAPEWDDERQAPADEACGLGERA
jgi:hypothetical protein